MQNTKPTDKTTDKPTESGPRSRTARAREKKAGISGLMLSTGAFLIVVCVILYGVYASHTHSKQQAAGQPANGQAADTGKDADQTQTGAQAGNSNAASGSDTSPDATGSTDPGTANNAADNDAAGASGSSNVADKPAAGEGNASDSGAATGGEAGTVKTPVVSDPQEPVKADPGKEQVSPPKDTAADTGSKPPATTGHASSKPPATYVVQKGDTLSTISLKFYHSKEYVSFLADRNGIVFVNDMKVGDTIKIPALTAGAGSGSGSGKQPDADYSKVSLPATYLVRPGDTFYRISVLFYKSGDYAGYIAKQNKLDENKGLKAGKSLTIPVKPKTK